MTGKEPDHHDPQIERRRQRVLVIDIRYKKPDGSNGRYRHDAQVQTMAAATAEERRLLANIAQYGDVHAPKPDVPEVAAPTTCTTFGEVVQKYRATYMITDLKVTTRGATASFSTDSCSRGSRTSRSLRSTAMRPRSSTSS